MIQSQLNDFDATKQFLLGKHYIRHYKIIYNFKQTKKG
jgi:hypothetical protein